MNNMCKRKFFLGKLLSFLPSFFFFFLFSFFLILTSSTYSLQAIMIFIITHKLGIDRLVSASSNCLFKGLPSRLRQFGQ